MTTHQIPLGEALRQADAREPWLSPWAEPAEVSRTWDILSHEDSPEYLATLFKFRLWPPQWRQTGGVLPQGFHGYEHIQAAVRYASFDQLLDRLFREVVQECLDHKSRWLAMVPQEKLDAKGRGVGFYFEPARLQEQWIPWQWWRPFLSRLESERTAMIFTGRLLIDRMPASAERHCVIHFGSAAPEEGA